MKRLLFQASALLLAVLVAGTAQATVGVDFFDPGWTYEYTGDSATSGGAWSSLDGTWDHTNGSDAWDGSAIGSSGPGGVSALSSSANYARIQDPGDTRDNGFSSPSDPNRKLYFGHDISSEGDTILDDGVTLTFRAKIATGVPLDSQWVRGSGSLPWPATGKGYQNFSNGRGMFGINQKLNADGETDPDGGWVKPARIGFSLVNSLDAGGSWGDNLGGLMMNDLDANLISENVDLGEGAGGMNFIAISDADLNDWHEFWISIKSDVTDTGTHEVVVYMDGALTGNTFLTTAGYDNSTGDRDYDLSFLSMGMGSSGGYGAYDVDFFAYRAGVLAPGPSMGDFDSDGDVDVTDLGILATSYGTSPGDPALGDADGDGDVDVADLGILATNYGFGGPEAVPEPAVLAMLLGAISMLCIVRRK